MKIEKYLYVLKAFTTKNDATWMSIEVYSYHDRKANHFVPVYIKIINNILI